ncbi:MAG: hypothetical protein E7E23_15610 [Paenibacillus sp.]|uniref:hypothetical protein n=1 Tax=Paenibacillus sp. TaxID=58172 RepID=UPI0028FF3E9D|nr:hypothetical protein [Paenibacillus sp.]MDU2241995.1 hypothetical protein [Paenibacillus sp.]
MFNHVKSLIWLLVSVSCFLAATLYTLEIGAEQNESYDGVAAQLHGVGRSVYAREGMGRSPETAGNHGIDDVLELAGERYTGNEILHRLPDWIDLGVTTEVEGDILNATSIGPLEDVLELSRERALAVLDLRAEYRTEHVFDSTGEVVRVIFRRK